MPKNTPGDPNCPHCHGEGVLLIRETPPFAYEACECTYYRRVARNVERGWKGLFRAEKLPEGYESPLNEYWDDDLWVTGRFVDFRAHLRWLAVRRPPSWHFDVVSDGDLMVSWLASTALKGVDILDPDAATISMRRLTLVDLVEPPSLLVIHLGVKKARNVAMSEVLFEALAHRAHIGKPTWVFDQPGSPLDHTHICYSESVRDFLSYWDHVRLDTQITKEPPPRPGSSRSSFPDVQDVATSSAPAVMGRRTGLFGTGNTGGTTSIDETLEEKVRKEADNGKKKTYSKGRGKRGGKK